MGSLFAMYGLTSKPASLLFIGGFILFAGCTAAEAEKGPSTVPLEGRIEFTKGGNVKALADQSVVLQFESVDQPGVVAFGSIMEDGAFIMGTQTDEGGKAGVVPGTHRVRLNADQTSARLVAPQFLSYDKSGIKVTVPTTGELVIKVWR
jgi:hypothetical protein